MNAVILPRSGPLRALPRQGSRVQLQIAAQSPKFNTIANRIAQVICKQGVRPGRGRLHEGVVFGTILSICSSSVLEAPHVRSLEFSGSPTNQDPAAIPEFG